MTDPKTPTNQTLLLQIVRDIEILKQQSIQILEASRDHENRIRDLEASKNKQAWIPPLISAVVTSVLVFLISKGLGQ